MLSERADLATLTRAAAQKRDEAHGDTVSYSRKVFIPLTKHCRDLCHYCTFSRAPKQGARIYMTADEVLAVAREGTAAGCTEALFTLGDKPELRYPAARAELDALGYPDTISYLREMADRVFRETGLFPHANAGLLTGDEFRALRAVSVSQGIMLESSAARLSERGGPHFRSPDKDPSVRLQSIDDAGRAAVPLTSGILIGIGETRRERI
ncbi:MAG: 7,8-didemethyl-8-hydroxy-5-deazariboflavin synthase CofG, partial [Pseudorhodoplanes sp.]